MMPMLYLLAFCRIAIGLVFTLSAAGKILNLSQFARTIAQFRMLPTRLVAHAAPLFLGGELAVALLMIVGGAVLWCGFALALFLLLLFSLALGSALVRKIRTSCNCFGTTIKTVSSLDLWRNAGLILCALGGLGSLAVLQSQQVNLTLVQWGAMGLAALLFVAVWLQLGEIVELFRA